MHDNSRKLCTRFVDGLVIHMTGPLAIADVGSRDVNGVYRDLFERPGWTYTGFDIEPGPNVDVVLPSPTEWNLATEHIEAFDVVVSGQTMEHTAFPWRWIKSVANLMKPGGLLWLAVPNTEVYHPYPIDCWRCWPSGMSAILVEGGLREILCFAEGPDTIGIARKP
jgi:hypothetical protein